MIPHIEKLRYISYISEKTKEEVEENLRFIFLLFKIT